VSGYRIQCNYDDMIRAGQVFAQQSDHTQQLFQAVRNCVGQLQSGDWIGQGAQNFFQEMHELVFPGVTRLSQTLHQASDATKRIVEALRQAEEEAGALFRGGSGGGMAGPKSGSEGTGGTTGPVDPRYQPIAGTEGNTVPAYLLNFRDPSFNMNAFIQNLNPEGRPVIFMVHGFREQQDGATDAFAQASRDYSAMYNSGELGGKAPIIIGVTWDSGTTSVSPDNYHQANTNAANVGPRFGDFLADFRTFHPDSKVDVIAHSLGNRFVLEGLASNPNARVDNYVAVEPAVNQGDFKRAESGWFGTSFGATPEGRFYSVVNGPQVGNMAATYNTQDRALWAHYVTGPGDYGRDTALGGTSDSFDGMTRINFNTGWANFDMNHYSYNTPEVRQVAADYFGLRAPSR